MTNLSIKNDDFLYTVYRMVYDYDINTYDYDWKQYDLLDVFQLYDFQQYDFLNHHFLNDFYFQLVASENNEQLFLLNNYTYGH